MVFDLEFIGEGKEGVEQVFDRGRKLAADLTNQLAEQLRKGSVDTVKEGFVMGIEHPLKLAKSWQILQSIDGYSAKTGAEVQAIASTYLTDEQMQEAFTIAFNAAFLIEEYGAPGYHKGHSILYDAIASRPESRFYGTITPELKTRLNNGRFWELLPELTNVNCGSAYPRIEDVLINHFDDLKVSFVPRGLKIFNRNAGHTRNFYLYSEEAPSLSIKAINRFADFVRAADSELYGLNIASHDFSRIVRPYVGLLFSEKEIDEETLFIDLKERLKDPLVEKYAQYL